MNTLEQKLFDLSIGLESISALTRAILLHTEATPEDIDFREHWRDTGSLAFLLRDQISTADELLMEIINSYGPEPQKVQVDLSASVVVAAVTKQPTCELRRTAV